MLIKFQYLHDVTESLNHVYKGPVFTANYNYIIIIISYYNESSANDNTIILCMHVCNIYTSIYIATANYF